MKALFRKTPTGLLPFGDDAEEIYNKVKMGSTVTIDLVRPRNAAFHAKFMSLLKVTFDYWEPDFKQLELQMEEMGLDPRTKPVKSFLKFRHNVTIKAGHYTEVVDLDGNLTLEPDSLSFANMKQETFDQFYKDAFQVCWDMVLREVPTMTEQEAHNLINIVDSYAGS
tara:strand:- start:1830 stop:2330 length:501 start_codon:yes stop_codon:yes gene_type:complete